MIRRAVVDRFFAAVLFALSVATTTAAMAGTSICGGTLLPIDTSVFGKPYVKLTLGGDNGNFLLDTGATHSQVDMRRYRVSEGSKIFLSGFSLPLVQSGLFTAADLRAFSAPIGGSLGTVGTDFLSMRSLEFHYEQPQPFTAVGRACDRAVLRHAGFVAVGLPGYYEAIRAD